jgi:hypothetical protein
MDHPTRASQIKIEDMDERVPLLQGSSPSTTADHVTIDQQEWIKPRFFLLIEICEYFIDTVAITRQTYG